MRRTGECYEVDWLIENYLSSDAPLVTSIVDEKYHL